MIIDGSRRYEDCEKLKEVVGNTVNFAIIAWSN